MNKLIKPVSRADRSGPQFTCKADRLQSQINQFKELLDLAKDLKMGVDIDALSEAVFEAAETFCFQSDTVIGSCGECDGIFLRDEMNVNEEGDRVCTSCDPDLELERQEEVADECRGDMEREGA